MGNIGSAFGGNSGNSGGGQLGSSDALRERRRNGIFPRTKKVDGGYLFPMNGLYSRGDKAKDLATSQEQLQEESEDFSYHLDLIQQFIVSRRLAPFYLGYNDEESIPTEKVTLFAGANDATALESKTVTDNASSSTTRPKSVSFNVSAANFIKSISSASGTLRRSGSFKQQGNPLNAETSSSDLAAETGKNPSHPTSPVSSHRNNHEDKVKPDYSDPVECPICFLLYPKNINYTRCCDHPICTECFIEIRRNTDDGSSACCPFCVRPEFGVYYNPPEKSRENDVSYDHRDYRASTLSLPISPTKKAQPSTSTVNVVVASGGRTSSVTSTSPSSIKRSNSELNMSAKVKKGSELPQQLIVTSDQIRPDFLKNFEKKQERERERSRLGKCFLGWYVKRFSIGGTKQTSQCELGSKLLDTTKTTCIPTTSIWHRYFPALCQDQKARCEFCYWFRCFTRNTFVLFQLTRYEHGSRRNDATRSNTAVNGRTRRSTAA